MRNLSSGRRSRVGAMLRALSWAAATCLAAAILLGACGSSTHDPCKTDAECGEGSVCRKLYHTAEDEPRCARVCTKEIDCLDPNVSRQVCRCPGGAAKGFCDGYSDPHYLDSGPEVCPADLNVSDECWALCDCPCGYHGECRPGPGSAVECRAGCEGALTAFPACTAALTAYYECAYRHSTCVFTTNHNCLNDGSYCWGTSPEQACPDEAAAVKACASASWWLFFPTPM